MLLFLACKNSIEKKTNRKSEIDSNKISITKSDGLIENINNIAVKKNQLNKFEQKEKTAKEKLLKKIESDIQIINKRENWSIIKQAKFSENKIKFEVVFYDYLKELQKISLKSEDSKTEIFYYFTSNQLIFVQENIREEIYKSYFENQKLIHQESNQDCGTDFNEIYLQEEENRILKTLKELQDLLT